MILDIAKFLCLKRVHVFHMPFSKPLSFPVPIALFSERVIRKPQKCQNAVENLFGLICLHAAFGNNFSFSNPTVYAVKQKFVSPFGHKVSMLPNTSGNRPENPRNLRALRHADLLHERHSVNQLSSKSCLQYELISSANAQFQI